MTSPTRNLSPPTPDQYHEYYAAYINMVGPDVRGQLVEQPTILKSMLGELAPDQVSCLHEPYTWTLKQLMGHLIDCERIFGSRLFRIAAGDPTPIPGIDQNQYVENMDYENVSMKALLKEFSQLRKANVLLVKRLKPEALDNMGVASDNPVSAKANLFILAGHVSYHLEIIKKRLGLAQPE